MALTQYIFDKPKSIGNNLNLFSDIELEHDFDIYEGIKLCR